MEQKEKTALVTGASSGIGFGIACDLSNAGYKVIINSRSKKKLEAASKKITGTIPIHADITCPEQSKDLLKKVRLHSDCIDVLVCNVGSGSSVAPGKESYKDWQKMFDINFFSTTNVIENSKNLITKNTGSIICISSSGMSKNIINACKAARKKKFFSIITLTGFSEKNSVKKLGNINFWVNSKVYNFIENIHQIIVLAISDAFSNIKIKK